MERLGVVIVCLLLVPLIASAAEEGMELTVHSGWSFLDADYSFNPCPECLGPIDPTSTTTLENSILFGFKAGYYLNRAMELEGAFAVAPSHRLRQLSYFYCPPGYACPARDDIYYPPYFSDTNAVAYQYSANFVYNMNASGVTPFLTFGVGGVSTDVSNETHTDFALNFGAGAKFYFERIGFRLELNDQVIPDFFLTGDTEHDLQVQYGLVFRLP